MGIVNQKILIYGILGVLLAGVSAWMHINDKDGSGWGFIAFLLFLQSCSL